MQRTFCRFGIRQERIAGKFGVGFRNSVLAGSAFPALNMALTEGICFNTGRVLASDTGHGLFSACVERGKPYNQFGS
jgi:hypothetical protein